MERYGNTLSIAGIVTAADSGLMLPGVCVEIVSAPEAFDVLRDVKRQQMPPKLWARSLNRPDRTLTRSDGSYRFLNLPPGQYRLMCWMKSPTIYDSTKIISVEVSATAILPPMTNFILPLKSLKEH